MATLALACGTSDNGDGGADGSSLSGVTTPGTSNGEPTSGATGSGDDANDDNESQTSGPTSNDDGPNDTTAGNDDGPPPGKCGPSVEPPATYDFSDNYPPSQDPPGGIDPANAPIFVSLGWDDNAYSGLDGSGGDGGMTWAADLINGRTNPAGTGNPATYDGTPITMTFYMTSTYIGTWVSESPTYVKRSWRRVYDEGHEMGIHTHSHLHGGDFSLEQWLDEIQQCFDWLTQPFNPDEGDVEPDPAAGIGVPPDELYGFRTPFLEYNDNMFAALQMVGQFWYDASVEEGFQPEQDGSNYLWPYTLDNGSPGHDLLVDWGLEMPMTNHPGLWEMPVYAFIVPPDDVAAQYGFEPGLRDRLHALHDWFDVEGGKITGFDYNLWITFEMTKEEVLATLSYSLDQRAIGNHAPMFVGTHTDYYSPKYTAPPNATPQERREAIEEFLDYALQNEDVRVVSTKQALDWVRNPQPLGCQ